MPIEGEFCMLACQTPLNGGSESEASAFVRSVADLRLAEFLAKVEAGPSADCACTPERLTATEEALSQAVATQLAGPVRECIDRHSHDEGQDAQTHLLHLEACIDPTTLRALVTTHLPRPEDPSVVESAKHVYQFGHLARNMCFIDGTLAAAADIVQEFEGLLSRRLGGLRSTYPDLRPEDVVQDFFLDRARKQLPRYDGRVKMASFVSIMIDSSIKDAIRRQRRLELLPNLPGRDQPPRAEVMELLSLVEGLCERQVDEYVVRFLLVGKYMRDERTGDLVRTWGTWMSLERSRCEMEGNFTVNLADQLIHRCKLHIKVWTAVLQAHGAATDGTVIEEVGAAANAVRQALGRLEKKGILSHKKGCWQVEHEAVSLDCYGEAVQTVASRGPATLEDMGWDGRDQAPTMLSRLCVAQYAGWVDCIWMAHSTNGLCCHLWASRDAVHVVLRLEVEAVLPDPQPLWLPASQVGGWWEALCRKPNTPVSVQTIAEDCGMAEDAARLLMGKLEAKGFLCEAPVPHWRLKT